MLITGADSLYIFSPPYEQLATMGILSYMAEKYRVYSPVILRKKVREEIWQSCISNTE